MSVQQALDLFLQTRIHGMGWGIDQEEPLDTRSVKLALETILDDLRGRWKEAKEEASASDGYNTATGGDAELRRMMAAMMLISGCPSCAHIVSWIISWSSFSAQACCIF